MKLIILKQHSNEKRKRLQKFSEKKNLKNESNLEKKNKEKNIELPNFENKLKNQKKNEFGKNNYQISEFNNVKVYLLNYKILL